GGLSHGSNVSGVECYNPLDHEWKVLGSVSRHRSGGGVASVNGSIYVVGGHDGVVCFSSVPRYEPETNLWKRDVAPISEAKRDVAVAELGGYLYCVGGYDGLLCLSTVERYDPELNRWRRVAPMNRRRRGLGLAVLDGYLYAVGGSDGCSPLYSEPATEKEGTLSFVTVERYNPTEDRWTPCSPMRTCREYLGCATFQGKIYAVGGRDDVTELRSVERFDPVANEWSAVMPMKSKRSKVSLAAANGYLLAIGGYDGTVHVTTVEAFDVEMNKWRRFGNTQTCHPGGGVTAINTAPDDRETSQLVRSR
ncbi:UNVERIFIED_CONTAM: hypothetical protein K2H54_043810, partial [Gekko kuhli]